MFSQQAINEAENLYNKVSLVEDQRQILISISELLGKYIPLSEIAIRGFGLMAIKELQKTNKMEIGMLVKARESERINFMTELFNQFKKIVLRTLHNSSDAQSIEQGINQGLKAYKENYAKR